MSRTPSPTSHQQPKRSKHTHSEEQAGVYEFDPMHSDHSEDNTMRIGEGDHASNNTPVISSASASMQPSTSRRASPKTRRLPSKRAYKKSAARLQKSHSESGNAETPSGLESKTVPVINELPTTLSISVSERPLELVRPPPAQYLTPNFRYPEELVDAPSRVAALYEIDQAAESTLTANLAYQSRLLAVMDRLSKAMERIDELQDILEDTQTEFEEAGASELKVIAPGTSDPTLPWFKHFHGHDLPPNPDGQARDLYLSTTRHVPWTNVERNKLKKEIVAMNHRYVATQAQAAGESIADRIARTDPAFFETSTEHLDWNKIAQVMPRRNAASCRIEWLQHGHPGVNKRKWTKKEQEALYKIAEKHGKRDWSTIAQELDTGRTAWDCVRQWRRRTGTKTGWTKEQDDRLREAVKLYGESWQNIALFVGRSSNQCINRWNKTVRPDIRRGKWTAEEDTQLRNGVALFGHNWMLVAPRVRGRTDAQCRERWVNVLDSRLLSQKVWSQEEEDALVRMRDEEGKTWSEIAAAFDHRRTDNHCLRRYKDIQARKAGTKKTSKKQAKRKRAADSGEDQDEDQDEAEFSMAGSTNANDSGIPASS